MSLPDAFELLKSYGTAVAFHYIPSGTTITVHAMRRRALEQPLEGDTSQQKTNFYVLADDFDGTPPTKNDRIEWFAETFTVHAVEPMMSGSGTIGGYKLTSIGT